MKVKKDLSQPYVSIVISAYNEEKHIESTLKNKFALNYPQNKIEIIVVSDGSTDKTDEIVKKFEPKGVKLIRQNPRSGKTSAINIAATQAKGDILIFSDANSIYNPDALSHLVSNFSDPDVGYVTGKMIYTNFDRSPIGDGCTSYMKYENFLRMLESQAGSIVGVDGGIDAVRKELYDPMHPDQLPDFVLPLKVIQLGYRVVYEPKAILNEPVLTKSEEEYRMRVRVALRSYWALREMRHFLGFKVNKLYAFQIWSHKVLRYLCFVFLIGGYITNLFLWPHGRFYALLFVLQNLIYLGAGLPLILGKNCLRFNLLYLVHYFVLLNFASAHAFIKFLLNQKKVLWTPRKG